MVLVEQSRLSRYSLWSLAGTSRQSGSSMELLASLAQARHVNWESSQRMLTRLQYPAVTQRSITRGQQPTNPWSFGASGASPMGGTYESRRMTFSMSWWPTAMCAVSKTILSSGLGRRRNQLGIRCVSCLDQAVPGSAGWDVYPSLAVLVLNPQGSNFVNQVLYPSEPLVASNQFIWPSAIGMMVPQMEIQLSSLKITGVF